LKFLFFFWDAFLNSDWSRGWIWKSIYWGWQSSTE